MTRATFARSIPRAAICGAACQPIGRDERQPSIGGQPWGSLEGTEEKLLGRPHHQLHYRESPFLVYYLRTYQY
jgi:hypothetical protein